MARIGFRGGKRMLCVGHGERCFACGGWGRTATVPPRTIRDPGVARCPVCRGRGRARVVEADDRR